MNHIAISLYGFIRVEMKEQANKKWLVFLENTENNENYTIGNNLKKSEIRLLIEYLLQAKTPKIFAKNISKK